MNENNLNELTDRVEQLEQKIADDDEYNTSDEFDTEYDSILDEAEYMKDFFEGFPDTDSEKGINSFNASAKRFKKLQKRIKAIGEDAGRDDGDDSWMYDKDEDELLD